MTILDCHTHHAAPQPEGVISVTPAEATALGGSAGQLYSVGIHPWETLEAPSEQLWADLERATELPFVVAIGECGVDTLKGGPMFRQLQVLKRQIELSERLGKPLILHDVKAHDILTGLRRDLAPKQDWVIHGFRGKGSVAKMLLDAGMYLSFGEKFNPEALAIVPAGRLLAETDESPLPIGEIIATLETAAGRPLRDEIAQTSSRIFLRN